MFDLNKKEKPFTSFGGFGGGGLGLAGGAIKLSTYVDDVFSTYVYTGTSSAGNAINNGIDLAGEGGIVWVKNRGATDHHLVTDEAGSFLTPSSTESEFTGNTGFISSFNSNGFTLGQGVRGSNNGDGQVSWTFRKAPGFFDVVTYTGNNTAGRTVAHNLGSIPGMIIVKKTSGTSNWAVWHRSLTSDNYTLLLNLTAAQDETGYFNDTAPTASNFTVSNSTLVNQSGQSYVAYVFAHDDASFGTGGNESIIKCGTYAGNGTATTVNIGFEPQWVLVKASDANYGWAMLDNMRGIVTGTADDRFLSANSSDEEQGQDMLDLTATGFIAKANSNTNANNKNYVYMAIRRPNKPPTAAIEVFGAATQVNPSGNQGGYRSGFVTDMAIQRRLLVTTNNFTSSRLLSGRRLSTNTNDVADAEVDNKYDYMNGYFAEASGSSTDKIAWLFKRAPGFFDIVGYSGNATAGTSHNHNLNAIPEFMMCKSYVSGGGAGWWCYHKDLSTNYAIRMDGSSNGNVAEQSASNYWNSSTHSSTTFTLGNYGDINGSGKTFISYLFATLTGISKVGSYSGSSGAVNVDCGFSSGARFVLIKRKDASGDWYLYDTTRGIVSGNDPYILLNTNGTQVTNTDYIDPLSSGFTVTSSAPTGLNASGGTYIFLAIA